MVNLVAERPRQQIFSANFKPFALGVLRFHRHELRSHHVPANSRNRKASFFFPLFALSVNKFRIDQHNLRFRIFSARHVHHGNAQTFPDLRCRESHSLRRIHRPKHVLGQLFEFRVKLRNRLRRLFQHGIAVFHHVINFSRRRCRLGRRGSRVRTGQFVGHNSRNSASSPSANLLQIFAEKHRPAQAPPLPRPPRPPPEPHTSPTARTRPARVPSSPCLPCAAPGAASKSASSTRAQSRLRRS